MAGIIKKLGNFLGVTKLGQAAATGIRNLTGEVDKDIQTSEKNVQTMNKFFYAAKQEKDPMKKKKLLELAKNVSNTTPQHIDPGLNLTNREILGSAANVGLNVLTPGATSVGKNVALGAAFGAASGLEQGRDAVGVIGSATGGALVGGVLGLAGKAAKAIKSFTTETTPQWLMEKAVKPTLDEARKFIKYGQKSLGQELLEEGVKGGPKKLLEIADTRLSEFEDKLQGILNDPALSEARIVKEKLRPYIKELVEAKAGVPGLKGDVKRIQNIFDDIPEQLTLGEANKMKRDIYNELRDVAYKIDPKLGVRAASLKSIARGLKTEIEKAVGGTVVQDINQKLSLYGRLENRITDQMARSMRNNSFGLTDAILTAGGVATMNPVGLLSALSAAGARHAAGSTAVRTTVAQGLNKLKDVGTGKVAKTLKEAARRATLNVP